MAGGVVAGHGAAGSAAGVVVSGVASLSAIVFVTDRLVARLNTAEAPDLVDPQPIQQRADRAIR